MKDIQEAFKKLFDFVFELAKAKNVEYDEDNASWGNADDSYQHGSDVACSQIAKEALAVLEEVKKILDASEAGR